MTTFRPTRRETALLLAGAAISCTTPATSAQRDEARAVMKRATRFMLDRCAHRGGYVWSYLPDFSRRWGEMEAYPTMQWVQPPGTATMGHLYLDAYHTTGDAFYLDAASQVADALVTGQHESGGWNYMIDTAGEVSLRRWYETIGKNGWRLEEFHHYYGNATFDDAGTAEASHLLLRIAPLTRSSTHRHGLQRAIAFVLESQFENGGWPQRFPAANLHGGADYTGYITFNDDVASENMRFLAAIGAAPETEDIWRAHADRIESAIARGMNCFLLAQHAAPQAGWALQCTHDMQPAAARSYEPRALATHTTAACIARCMDFYVQTGDRRFLSRLPEALAWLESVRLPEDQIRNGRAYPTFIELETNRALYVHRRGSNVVNGAYFWDYSPNRPITHYSQTRAIDAAALQARLDALEAASESDLDSYRRETAESLRNGFYRFVAPMETSDLNAPGAAGAVSEILTSLNAEGYWPTPLTATSNPYIGDGPATPPAGDFGQTHVGDASDTSPYTTASPVIGISTSAYIEKMAALIAFLRASA